MRPIPLAANAPRSGPWKRSSEEKVVGCGEVWRSGLVVFSVAQAERRIRAMQCAFEERLCDRLRRPSRSDDLRKKDRDVLAAAGHTGAQTILTENMQHLVRESRFQAGEVGTMIPTLPLQSS